MTSRSYSYSPGRPLGDKKLPFWRALPIILGVMVASAALAAILIPQQLVLVGVVLFAAMGALVVIRWPTIGLIGLVVASLVVPFSVGTSTQTRLNITVLMIPGLMGLWLLDMIGRQRRVSLVSSRPLWALGTLLVVTLLAFIAGQLPWFFVTQAAPLRAQIGGLAIFLVAAAAFILVANQVRDIRWLEWLTWIFLGLGAVYVAGRLLPGVGQITQNIFQLGADGSLFWVWVVALALSQGLFNDELKMPFRLALLGLVAAAFYWGLTVGISWASGWLPPLVAAVVIFLVARPRLGLVTSIVLFLVGVGFYNNLISLVLTNEQYSIFTRLEAWRIITEITEVSPLLGLGPANYYYYTPLYPILGYNIQFNSHNQYVDIIAQTGILGLLALLWFFGEVGWLGLRLRQKAPTGFAKAYIYGAIGGLAGMVAAGMLGDWVLPFVYNIGVLGFRSSVFGWLFLGGLVAVEQMLRAGSIQTEPAEHLV